MIKKKSKKKKEIKISIDSIRNKNMNNNEDDLIEADEKKENKNEENLSNKDENKKNNKEDNINVNSFNVQMVGSGRESKKNVNLVQIASADEAKFNRLKKNIVDNQETFIIFYMKLLNLLFVLLSIFFIVYDSIINTNNIEKMDKFLNENLIANHSKFSAGILYLEANIYKCLRDDYIKESSCLTGNCSDVYVEQIIFCIDDLREEKDKFSSLSEEFAEKVNVKEYLTLFNKNSSETIEVNMEFMMNLLINYSLRIKKANRKLKEYLENSTLYNESEIEENNEKLDLSLNNLIEQSDKLASLNINGFSGNNKTEKINKLFNPFPISLVVMVIFIVLFIGGFFYFIYYLYTYEVFFIGKLIDFNNPKYESYLRQLEELKKKLRNENEDDDDDDKEDDLGFGTGMGTKKDDDSKKNKVKDYKDKNDDDKKDKEDQKKKRIRGKEKSKLQHQQKKKKNIMRNFFLRINLFFCIKIFILAFFGLTYYIFSTVIKSNTRIDYLEKEHIADQTEGIYKESLDIHLNLVRKVKIIMDFVNLEEELKEKKILIYNNTAYTNLSKFINENFPNFSFPNIDQIAFPKLGNLLMPIVSSNDDDSSSIQSQFNELYNRDACKFLFPDLSIEYASCLLFWNGIIAKGMEQSLTQMSVALTSVLDDLKNINNKNITKDDLRKFLKNDSYFYNYQVFIEYYFYLAYLRTSKMFIILRKEIVHDIKQKYYILLILYLIVSVFLFGIILLFIYSLRSYFNSFLNFVAIFPLKFIIEDENLFRQTLNLDDSLFR